MRHADIATTMNVYGDSVPKQRRASSKVVQLLLTNRKAGREKQCWAASGSGLLDLFGPAQNRDLTHSKRDNWRFLRDEFRTPRDPQPAQRWRAFLANHREAFAAMDFFHGADDHFRCALLFFLSSPMTAGASSHFKRHQSIRRGLDRSEAFPIKASDHSGVNRLPSALLAI